MQKITALINQLTNQKKAHPLNHNEFAQLQKHIKQLNLALWQETIYSSLIGLAIALIIGFGLKKTFPNRLQYRALFSSQTAIANVDQNNNQNSKESDHHFNQYLLQCLRDLDFKKNETINAKEEAILNESKTTQEETTIDFNWYKNSAGKRAIFNTETQLWQTP
jgi:hypothetical protein